VPTIGYVINCWKCAKPLGKAVAGAMAVVCACGAATVTQAHVAQPADPVPYYALGTGGGLSSAWYDAYHDEPGGREIDSASDGVVTPGTQSVFTVRPRWHGNFGGSIPPF
jgi:hypothetical protein